MNSNPEKEKENDASREVEGARVTFDLKPWGFSFNAAGKAFGDSIRYLATNHAGKCFLFAGFVIAMVTVIFTVWICTRA